MTLKNAFNNPAVFTLSDERKICAANRIIRADFASSAEIIWKPSDCWCCYAIAVPSQRLFHDCRVHINACVGCVYARTVDQAVHRAHLLSGETSTNQRGGRHGHPFR